MDKRSFKIYAAFALIMLATAVFHFAEPETRIDDATRYLQPPEARMIIDGGDRLGHASIISLIAGICALLLVAYLFWVLYCKFITDSRADQIAKDQSLYGISLATGRTEYELFCESAEKWSVARDLIDRDFKRYMAEQVLPHYAMDFVRKNQAHIDPSLVRKKEVKPSSWSDWAKALLVFPGSVLFLLSMSLFLV